MDYIFNHQYKMCKIPKTDSNMGTGAVTGKRLMEEESHLRQKKEYSYTFC